MDRFLELLRTEFETALQAKTGWGRIEVMVAFDRASVKAVVAYAKEKHIVLD